MGLPKSNATLQPSARHTEEGDRFNRTLFAALDALEEGQVPYALIGGVAVSGLGRPRSTHDIDIFVRPEEADAALEALEKYGFKIERTDPIWLYKGWKENILVDIIFKSYGDIYFDDEMAARTRGVSYHGRDVKTVSPEDLIIIKSAVHSENGPHHWHDALAILSHANVEWPYLLKRARRAPRRLLALLIYAQSNDIWVPNHVVSNLFKTIFDGKEQVPTMVPTKSHSKKENDESHHGTDAYMIGRIKEVLAQDHRIGDQDLKIMVGEKHILVRGDSTSEGQKRVIEEVIHSVAPGFLVDNQIKVQVFPGPEGTEMIV